MSDPNGNTFEKSGRHTEWAMTLVSSIIALVALVKHYDGDLSDQEDTTKWAASGICIALIFSALGVIGNMAMKERFIGTMIEGGLALLACGFWAAVLPTVMGPKNDLAVAPMFGAIQNANLYFFSWGGLITSFMALSGFFQEWRGSRTVGSTSTIGALSLTSFVTMMAAYRLWDANDCENRSGMLNYMEEACNRTAFAISLGAISVIMTCAWVLTMMLLKGRMGVYFEAFSGVLMLALWCFGVGYITFGGDSAPASVLGNLYFFTWGSFALSVVVFMASFKNFMNRNEDAVEPERDIPENVTNDAEKQQEPEQGMGADVEA